MTVFLRLLYLSNITITKQTETSELGEAEVQLQPFATQQKEEGGQHNMLATSPLGKICYPLYWRMGGPQGQAG